MRLLLCLAAAVWLVLTAPAWAQSVQGGVASESLSTRLEGVDTLGIMPTEVVTPYQGGTRRVNLESTIFRRETPIVYSAESRRDPFRPLIVDDKRGDDSKTDLLIVEGATLTGVVWAEGQYLAMVKDRDARTFFLREGDSVYKGRVVSVTQTHIVVEISDFGEYRQVTLKVND